MIEIHDASPADGGPYALFGFIGIPPAGREDVALLRQHLIAQLIRLFGPQAATPKQLKIQDWASAKYTATEADKEPMYAHPNYGLPPTLTKLWNNKLHFAGTEVGAVALAMLSENIGANLIGVSSGMLREMRLCGPFLFQRQVALTLAVILQPEKRQTHTCKGKTPFRQHCGTDVQYLADGLGIVTRIQ